MNGRSFFSLAKLLPGTTRTGGNQQGVGFNSQKGFAVRGLRATYTGVIVDGIRDTDMGSNNTQITSPGLETLSEVKMQRKIGAEYSSPSGAEMVLSTRSGTT